MQPAERPQRHSTPPAHERKRPAARPDAPIFGRIRAHPLASAKAAVIKRLQSFIAAESSPDHAKAAVQILLIPDNSDAEALGLIRHLLCRPAPARAPAPKPGPVSVDDCKGGASWRRPSSAAGAPAPGAASAPPPRARAGSGPAAPRRPAAPALAPGAAAPHAGALFVRTRPGVPPGACVRPTGGASKGSGRERSRLADVAAELEIARRAQAAAPPAAPFAYLDVGCAEGRITAAIAGALGLAPPRAAACDVAPQPPSPAFDFSLLAAPPGPGGVPRLPYPDASFDLATMFMSAHHFADAAATFAEVRRVLRPGALLLLREHDCSSDTQRLFYDAVHALYATVYSAEMEPEAFVGEYLRAPYASYRSRDGWIQLAAACGFELHPEARPHGPVVQGAYASDRFDSFYALFRVGAPCAPAPAAAVSGAASA